MDFKGKAKAFTRTYDFLASILPYNNPAWEKLSIFLTFLVPKLPAPIDEDLSKGILEAIDMDSYRAEKKAAMRIALPDEDAEIEPVPTSGGGRKPEPELDRLSNILKSFNDHFGTSRGLMPTAFGSSLLRKSLRRYLLIRPTKMPDRTQIDKTLGLSTTRLSYAS